MPGSSRRARRWWPGSSATEPRSCPPASGCSSGTSSASSGRPKTCPPSAPRRSGWGSRRPSPAFLSGIGGPPSRSGSPTMRPPNRCGCCPLREKVWCGCTARNGSIGSWKRASTDRSSPWDTRPDWSLRRRLHRRLPRPGCRTCFRHPWGRCCPAGICASTPRWPRPPWLGRPGGRPVSRSPRRPVRCCWAACSPSWRSADSWSASDWRRCGTTS